VTGQPVIGISSYCVPARWGSWDLPAVVLPRGYTDHVAAAGGLPVLLPPVPGVADTLSRLDGLVLSGGGDIDPALYGAARDAATGPASTGRDTAELALCQRALAEGVPVLAICRGLQVVNVALGGTLHQHLPDLVGHDGHSPDPGGYGTHKVSIAPGSRLAGLLGLTETPGPAEIMVPTHHHQAIDRLGAGLAAAAWADDGIIEAAEPSGSAAPGSLVAAVQWHPEAADDPSLFTALVASARQYQAGRG
jgi:putative glutamine amidotransferase